MRLLLICLAASLGLFTSCAKRMAPYTSMVTFVSEKETEGTITLRANGYSGLNSNDATVNSEKNAINTLLFRGVPNSQQVRPMIPDETAARQQNPAFFKQFVDDRGYGQFIVSANPQSAAKWSRRNRQVVQEIKINVRSMRTYLEQNNVVRAFGF